MNGILNINKPQGMTSHDVVATVRKIIHEKKVGHAGTLDPNATGVLPVLIGSATKCSDFFLELGKAYKATARFGLTSDTQDIWGTVTEKTDFCPDNITEAAVAETLKSFEGTIFQVPPAYSAIKMNGIPLYKLARKGAAPEQAARPVIVYKAELLRAYKEDGAVLADIYIHCGRGTYIRTVINDLGERLGCGAVMSSLTRVSYGELKIDNGLTVEELKSLGTAEIEGLLVKSDSIFSECGEIRLSEAEFMHYMQGRRVYVPADRLCGEPFADTVRLYKENSFFATCGIEPSEDKSHFRLIPGRYFGLETAEL